MTITNADLHELLDAIRSGGDIDVVRRGVEFMLQALIDAEATARIGAERFERTTSPDHAAQRDPGPAALDQGRRRRAQDPEAALGELLPVAFSSAGAGSTGPSSPWSWRPTCTGCRRGRSTTWSSPSASSRGSPSPR